MGEIISAVSYSLFGSNASLWSKMAMTAINSAGKLQSEINGSFELIEAS